jgi:DNA-binding response OmpR family regulator
MIENLKHNLNKRANYAAVNTQSGQIIGTSVNGKTVQLQALPGTTLQDILFATELAVQTLEAGLQALRARPPALLLLDWQLPDGDGMDLLRQLPALGVAPPVVVVSANAQPEQIAAARAAGARHYLTKPLDVRELLAVIDELLAASSPAVRAE